MTISLACRFLDISTLSCAVAAAMRRSLRIDVAFEPIRTAHAEVRAAYALVAPEVGRVVVALADSGAETRATSKAPEAKSETA